MQQLEGFYHSKFRRTLRTSTSEHVITSEPWRWPERSGVPETVTFKNVEAKNQFIKFNQTGAGVWTPGPMIAEADVQKRGRQLEARIKVLQDDRYARDPVIDSPLPSFASIQTLDAALTAKAKSRVTEYVVLTPAAASLPPGLPVPDLLRLRADYYYDAQDNYPDFITLKIIHEAVREHGPPGDPSSSSSSSTSSSTQFIEEQGQ